MSKPLTTEQLAVLRAAPLPDGQSNRVRIAMALAGVQPKHVLGGVNFTANTLSGILSGRTLSPELPTAQALAEFFGCDVSDLFPPQGVAA